MTRPQDARYAETHEWVRPQKNGTALVGITDYAVHQLSDLVHIELPKVGTKIERGAPFGEIESVKTVADLMAPVTGDVVEINTALPDRLELLHEEPFEKGWMLRVKIADPAELGTLMSAPDYQKFVESAEGDQNS